MKSFACVEDYLEIISGYRDPVTNQTNNWFVEFKPIINLARYDVRVLETMTHTVASNLPLTERQGELLCKLILNYSRQLAARGIDVAPVRQPQWRMPLRHMDYTRRLVKEGDILVVQFPFNTELVEDIKTFARDSQGSARWNRERKVWLVSLTEYNVSWLHAWAVLNQFEIDPAVHDLMQLITAVEKLGYRIELDIQGDRLNISNCEHSLIDYVEQHLGGFALDNLLQLVDNSSHLGYTVAPAIAQQLITQYGARFYNLLSSREIKINPTAMFANNDFDSVLDYADALQRWPVVVYEPDLSGRMLTKLRDRYGDDLAGKYIHTIKPVHNLKTIPLLISSAGMMFGGDKSLMVQNAEKIVYCAAEVYNKK